MSHKILSWNVNGIRAILKKDFIKNLEELNVDILCLQEIKALKNQIDYDFKELGYNYSYINSSSKKGYAGVAIFSKIKPKKEIFGIGNKIYDIEGRIITLEFENFFLINVYTPNSQRMLKRFEYRNSWDKIFLDFINKLKIKKSVIICGDFNVAHKEIDLKNPIANKTTLKKPGNAGFTDMERENFSKLLENDLIDIFRYNYPQKIQYTWWSYMFSAREKNIGWRIDYFLISKDLIKNIIDIKIKDKIKGSDHCPIFLEFEN